MLVCLMSPELVAYHQTDLLTVTEADRLALRVRRARREQRRSAPRVRRTWVRTATRPAHP